MTGDELAGILEHAKSPLRLTLSSGSVVDIETVDQATIQGSVLYVEGNLRRETGTTRPKIVSIEHIALIETVGRRT